ncbi:MAG: multicomponent Na+:H+ antiporter subunit D [Gammaproteobacteria bacterium]
MSAFDIGAHLPVLQVVVPLVAAPVSVLVNDARRVWWLAFVVSSACLAISIGLLSQVSAGESISYLLGGWAAPWGIEYRVDALNALVLVLVSGLSTVALVFARESVEREISAERVHLFYTAWLLCLTGLLGISVTGDAFNVFVFLEISSLSTYSLVAFGRQRQALSAAFRYLVMGTIGGTFILIGIGLLYAMTGTLNMADLAVRLEPVRDSASVRAAFAFIVVGAGLKMAMFPLHAWLPGAYANAPSAASVFIAATSTKVAVYVLLRFTFTIFGLSFSFDTLLLAKILMVFAVLGVVVGSIAAIVQQDLKRMLAWSSVAQIGYMLIGIACANMDGLTATLVHMFNHALMKGALFMAIGCVAYRIGYVRLDSVAGLAHRMPWTFGAFALAGLSLIGVPFTAGFVSKWYLLLGVVEHGWWPLAGLLVLTSLMAIVYIGRVLEVAWFHDAEPNTVAARATEAPLSMLIPLWTLVLANIWFGIQTTVPVDIARTAAATMLGLQP